MITVYAYKWVPDFARGLVRDLRVRWALEEAGLPYQVHLLDAVEKNSPEYRVKQPFAQVPVFEEDGFVLFESGAIVLHVGERSEALLPADPAARARAIARVFAALNSIEVRIQPLTQIDIAFPNEEWAKARRPEVEQALAQRLADLAARLGDKDYLEGRFTAGDLMMATVLRFLRHTDLVAREPKLRTYLDRCEARPAFQRALAGQLAGFQDAA